MTQAGEDSFFMSTALLIAVFLPFVAAFVIPWAGARMGRRVHRLAMPVPLISCALIAWTLGQHEAGTQVYLEVWGWVPELGLDMILLVDGLSLFFGLVVSGMGVLIFWYAGAYLDEHYSEHNRFYSYLLLFMGAMLGTVFGGNLLFLFIFWELTGISSFLLIGFLYGTKEGQSGSRMALLTTVFTGLVLLAGVALLGLQVGSLHMRDILAADLTTIDAGMAAALLLLFAIGAFGKSAQAPFHFWLPNAMSAPTPVSAYLHSATMVKLGVFLSARMFPVFVEHDLWAPVLAGVGFATLLIGSVFAFFSHKLKAILAYTTVAMLGLFIGFYGISETTGARFDFMHILNHTAYKGALFMVVGIIDHATHLKHINQLGGLWRRMPLLGFITIVCAASMAGIPLTSGFISKEYLLTELYRFYESPVGLPGWLPLVFSVVAFAFMAAVGIRLVWHIFFRPETKEAAAHFHHPGLMIHLPPLVLAMGTLVFGIFPALFGPLLQSLATPGTQALLDPAYTFKLWHGINAEFLTSMGILALSLPLFAAGQAAGWRWEGIPRLLLLDIAFEKGVYALPRGAASVSRALRADHPLDYIPLIAVTVSILTGGYLLLHLEALNLTQAFATFPETFYTQHLFVATLITLGSFGIVFSRRWTTQLIFLSTVGFLITVYFVLYQAPDLALTQILIEAATLILILLILDRFPRSIQRGQRTMPRSGARKSLNIAVSSAVGLTMFLLTYGAMMRKEEDFIGRFFLENTVELAKGSNAVNTVLVDFRGFDTLLEIAVLLIAILGAMGLIMRYRRKPDELNEAEFGPGGFGMRRDNGGNPK